MSTPLKDVIRAVIHVYADGVEVSWWDDFEWDETMGIRDTVLHLLDSFNDHRLRLTADGDLIYMDEAGKERVPLPELIVNADFTFGYKENSQTVRFIGDRIPIKPYSRRGSNQFKGIIQLEICFEPEWL